MQSLFHWPKHGIQLLYNNHVIHQLNSRLRIEVSFLPRIQSFVPNRIIKIDRFSCWGFSRRRPPILPFPRTRRGPSLCISIDVGCITIGIDRLELRHQDRITPRNRLDSENPAVGVVNITFIRAHSFGAKEVHSRVVVEPFRTGIVHTNMSRGRIIPGVECLVTALAREGNLSDLFSPHSSVYSFSADRALRDVKRSLVM